MTTTDLFAELVVAACAAASSRGCHVAHSHVTADDFASAACRAVFEAAVGIPDAPIPTDGGAAAWSRAYLAGEQPATIWPSELRLIELARRLHVPVVDLESLVALRPVDIDATGLYARRVLAAARRRQLEDTVVALHELVHGDTDNDRVADVASSIVDMAGA